MASLIDANDEAFPDTLNVQPGALDAAGAFVAAGSSTNLIAFIIGKTTLVRGPDNREVVSSVKAVVELDATLSPLTVDKHRYKLPARYAPNQDSSLELIAIMVGHVPDEDGAHHETVFFP